LFESANIFAVETIVFGGMIESLVFGPLGKSPAADEAAFSAANLASTLWH